MGNSIGDMLAKIDAYYHKWRNQYVANQYQKKLPYLVSQMRAKDKITVLFVLTDLAKWKTELLYRAMLEHPRFSPCIGITYHSLNSPSKIATEYRRLVDYCEVNKYDFVELHQNCIQTQLKPDIIVYSEPYEKTIREEFSFRQNKESIFIYVSYGFNTLTASWNINTPLKEFLWQQYVENDDVKKSMDSKIKGRKYALSTGTPMMDELLLPPKNDPWKENGKRKKRIIWAPHFTINQGLVNLSTFMIYADFMIDMAKKYKDEVQFCFKPHPLLASTLVREWGKQKQEEYYSLWDKMENTQIHLGKYNDLFAYSDAMIHDCGSFVIEYLYYHKPVLFLTKESKHNELFDYAEKAYNLHYHAKTKNEIEDFILSVITGDDRKQEQREKFFQEYLVPKGGMTACDNIINSILNKT